jgi:predicted lipoprotein
MSKPFCFRLLGLAAVLLSAALPGKRGLAQPVSQPAFTREAMLREIARDVLVSEWQELAGKCRDLTNSIARLVEKPDPVLLEEARKGWLEASLAASRLRCFQAGPIVDRDFVSTFYYWQVLPYRMQEVLNSPRRVDQGFLEELGATVKGLFAVEYLLFEHAKAQTNGAGKAALILDGLAGPDAEKHRAYLIALGQELASKATLLGNDWTAPGGAGASQKLTAGGQESVNLLVNQLATGIEDTAERHLNFVLVLPNPISRQLYRVERSRSGSSLEGLLAGLEGAQKLFTGGGGLGLKDAVRQVNPALEKRVAEQFETAIAATRAIGAPLEEAVVKNRASIEVAYEKTRVLEVLVKVDVVSALGVTLTFSSNDGD